MLLMDSYLPCRLAATDALVSKSPAGMADFIERQEEYIQQLEKESRYCRSSLCGGCPAGRAYRPHDEAQGPHLGERGAYERRARLPGAYLSPCPARDTGYSLQHGPDPAAVPEGARLAVRVPHLRAAGSAYPGPYRVPVPAAPRWARGLDRGPVPPLSPWPDPLGVWWGHLGWLRAELRAAPVPVITEAEEPPSDAVDSAPSEPEEQRDTPQAEDVPQPEPADPESLKSVEPEPAVECPSPCPSEAADLEPLEALPELPQPVEDDEASSSGSAASEAQQLLQLSLPDKEGPKADDPPAAPPLITVNVEVKFRVSKKDRKRSRSSSNK
ncbi:vegetative cell wall protein gp1-like isoform X2 [Thrips palmi]|nr:vegetative cell wall protein gp1-like isoform X2 [Thrips palmi]